MAFFPVTGKEAYQALLRGGLPGFIDAIGLGAPAADASTDTELERNRSGSGNGGAGDGKPPTAADPTRVILTAAAVLLAVVLAVWILVRVFK